VSVDGQQVTISGIVDLLHVTDDWVEIVDYKTDRGRHAEAEYRKQLSVYYHVVRQEYPDHRVSTSIYYTADGERVDVDPLLLDELGELVDLDETHEERGEDPAKFGERPRRPRLGRPTRFRWAVPLSFDDG
jgi:hypothetical protein